MVLPDQLAAVLRELERSGLPYAVTGSLASIVWGRPRATYNADIVIALRPADVDRLLAAFPGAGWYVDRESILEAIRAGGEFNAIEAASGTKVDFWVKTARPADAARFARRRRAPISGVECWVLSPEDTILAKLEWIRAAPSDRQQRDVAGIVAARRAELDEEYLRDWAGRLDVRALLEAALSGRWDGA